MAPPPAGNKTAATGTGSTANRSRPSPIASPSQPRTRGMWRRAGGRDILLIRHEFASQVADSHPARGQKGPCAGYRANKEPEERSSGSFCVS